MKSTFRRIAALLMAAILTVGMTACSSTDTSTDTAVVAEGTQSAEAADSGTSTAVSKDALTIALPGEPQTLDPYAHSMYYNFMISTLIYDTLITKDADGEYVGELATEWEFVDDLTLNVKLRDDVTFHDGSKLTADDVKFTLKTAAESSFSSSIFAWYDDENTTVVSDTEINICMNYAYAAVLEVLSSIRSAIVDDATYSEDPDSYTRTPNGTGPMMVSEWYSGDRIELVTNEDYWGDALSFSTCTCRIIVESSSRTIELETGGVDIVLDVSYSDWSRVTDTEGIELVSGRTDSMASLVFNCSLDLFSDVRVRKALAYALDVEAIVTTCWEGTAEVADSYYTSTMLGYKQEGPQEQNIELAKELLAEAGYPDGFEFTYTTYQTTLNSTFSEVVKQMWQEIGVTANIEIVDLATFTDMNNSGQLTVALMTPSVAISDPSAALILWPITRTISLRHNDQHIQDLLDEGSSTYDEAARIEIYQELQDYLAEMTYTVPIAYPTFAFGISSDVQGFVFQSSQIIDLTDIYFG